MIIDTHVHLYSFPSLMQLGDRIRRMEDAIALRTRHPEVYAASLTEPPVDISDALIADMDRHGIGHALVQARAGYVSNDLVGEAAQRHPDRLWPLARVGHDQEAAGYLRDPAPAREKAPAELARCLGELGFKGVGECFVRSLTAEIHPERIADDLQPVMDVVARFQVPIQFPTAWSQFPGGLFWGHPAWVDEVAMRNPRVPIVLTKMGRSIGYYFDMALTVAMRNVNVYFDVVGTSPAHLRQAADAIGAHRIMFGSDWSATWRWLSDPADLYTIRKRVLDEAGLTPDERAQIEWKTAAEVFRLEMADGS